MTSFSIQTFGCRSNQAEAFLWAYEFQKHGLKYEKDFSRSDLVVVNSCTLTSRADSDTRSFIRRVSRLNPKARLIVTGCYAQRAPEELRNMPQVSCLLSNTEKKDLDAKVLSFAAPGKERQISPFRSRASVKIQDGRNFQCTFCIIPSVRGGSVSLDKREVLDRIKEFINQGFKEIVLTGIHLCSYGLDLKTKSSLLELLQDIESLNGLAKLRLSSLDPRFLSSSLMEHITASGKVCPHFHLSLQSGSDDILQRMGRKIRIEDYKKILTYLREKSPRASLGADIIVGFPGETGDDFSQTYRFLEQSPLTYFHVFSYSPRPGTVAASWQQVNGKVKKERARLLRDLSSRKNTNFRRLFLGKECEAIVIKKEKARTEVLTSNYFKVFIPSCPHDEGKEVRVKIRKVDTGKTTGQIVNSSSS
ncbi:MAG: tRNA (N(6)-L-threonylcarbamoyladenosine(37)-C(2))-methylthiotransferase MtaB [Candidatus Aminicenantes bacterium]|nr:tRNA (N(6)-L-threonylcarbamoyladenosine(37)-C(2))-methylthiotransferase MtaB [Candidatus Aminicenantes bacterium]